MEEETSKQIHADQIIMTLKHLRSSLWKCFEFFTIDGKMTNKDKAVFDLIKMYKKKKKSSCLSLQ